MFLQYCIDYLLSGQYVMKWRSQHSTVVISDRLYCWGGLQEDLPTGHFSDEKKFTSSVDIFHLPKFKWERKPTTATPPAGVVYYACTTVRDKIFYFGGSCKPIDCFHNELFELDILTNEWREIINSSPDIGPMRKRGCGMITFNINAEDNLLVIGGIGHIPISTQTNFQYLYTPNPKIPNLCYTNEIHTMCVNSSPGIIYIMYYFIIINYHVFSSGQWKVPIITGDRPPPSAGFSIKSLPGNKGVMFGGVTRTETGITRLNDLFLLSFSENTIVSY